jgi:polyhydroxyalkanoate synthase
MSSQNPGFDWAQQAAKFQETAMQTWRNAMQSFGQPTSAVSAQPASPLKFEPQKLMALQQQYLNEASALWTQGMSGKLEVKDKRFAGDAWKNNHAAAFMAASYLLNARTLLAMVEAVDADAKTKNRLRFSVEQWAAASAPTNFLALNAEAQQKAIDTQGASIAQGVANLLKDIQQGHVSMTDESLFEVGKNVATTEGAVVYENEFFQLLEYKPLTAKVYERPFLMVPPCINKFYILDLQPTNSFVRYAVAEGHRTFVVSWRNPDQTMAGKTWDDYIEQAVIKAIHTTQDISGAKQINALGFCVGGTMLTTALGVLRARGEDPVASATLLTTLVEFSDTGVLDVFIDDNMVRYREMEMGHGGLMSGNALASTFSFLRPTDLVWNYVAGNYLKGETPPPFDLLYWNSDSTNLPGPYYAWYLRHTYLQNDLVKPGAVTVCGVPLDLSKVDMPAYIYGSREDHIVPIGGAYATTQVLTGDKRFVMGASGHIAGVINAPAAKKRSHWIGKDGEYPESVDEWIAQSTEYPGSWWPDWAAWLQSHAGKQIAAPKAYGKGSTYKASQPAPGSYVKVKA